MFNIFSKIKEKKNQKYIQNMIDTNLNTDSALDFYADYLKMIHEHPTEYFDYLHNKYPNLISV